MNANGWLGVVISVNFAVYFAIYFLFSSSDAAYDAIWAKKSTFFMERCVQDHENYAGYKSCIIESQDLRTKQILDGNILYLED